jgi:hypothetical protein
MGCSGTDKSLVNDNLLRAAGIDLVLACQISTEKCRRGWSTLAVSEIKTSANRHWGE